MRIEKTQTLQNKIKELPPEDPFEDLQWVKNG